MDQDKRRMAGTFGQLWLDGELVGETYRFQATVEVKRDTFPMCGSLWDGNKLLGLTGKGTLAMYKVNSRMAELVGSQISQGKDPRFTLISKLDDPDAYGAERVVVKNVGFNDHILADWEAGKSGSTESPFIFSGYEYIDIVEA